MIKFIKASYSLAKNIKTTGAITETSAFVAKEVTRYVNPNIEQLIVEMGAGHGNITIEILKKMHPNSKLFCFENNEAFCSVIKTTFNDNRLIIINDDANNFEKHLGKKPIDIVISTLPLTLFPKKTMRNLLSKVNSNINNKACFSQVYYSLTMLKELKAYFSKNKISLTLNFPPAFVIHSIK